MPMIVAGVLGIVAVYTLGQALMGLLGQTDRRVTSVLIGIGLAAVVAMIVLFGVTL